MNYINRNKKTILSILFFMFCAFALIGCTQGTENNFSVLGFLPSGIKTATGEKLMHNTNYKIVALIPILEPLLGWLITLVGNVFDCLLWFIAWIPGVKQAIGFIYRLPDIDQIFTDIFHHRNFITHSVLNPGFVVLMIICIILSRKLQLFQVIGALIGCIFAFHLLADSLPLKWVGFAKIYVSLGNIKLLSLPGFLSKLWLWVNALLTIKIASLNIKEE